MKSTYVKYLAPLMILLILLGIPLYLLFLNDEFCKKNIGKTFSFNEFNNLNLTSEVHNIGSIAFEQPYTYLSWGSQCYV